MSEPTRASPKTTLVPGDILAGKYRVERAVGEGRTAVVYEATNLRLDERVALKMLKSEMQSDPEMAARFTREAHALAKLRSEHVARAVDVEDLPDGMSIMVMEYLDGQNLEKMIERGPLPLEQAADFVIQTCEGLTDAHARGIVHRDVKPENIFIVLRDGWRTVKLLDFGISKALVSNTTSAIRTQSVMGSPVYMSPEQLRSTQTADPRADIWSLGAVFFELLTGRTAFEHEGRSLPELVTAILEQPPRRLTEFRPDLPASLQPILDRCLEKDVDKRYQNAVELGLALLPFAPSRSRSVVEKALNTARAAGLVSPDIALPPSGHMQIIEANPSIRPASPAAAGAATLPAPASATSRGSLLPPGSLPPAPTPAAAPSALSLATVPPARGRSRGAIAGAFVGLVGLAFAGVVFSRRGTVSDDRVEPPSRAATASAEPRFVEPSATPPPTAAPASATVIEPSVRPSATATPWVPKFRAPAWAPFRPQRSPPTATPSKEASPPAISGPPSSETGGFVPLPPPTAPPALTAAPPASLSPLQPLAMPAEPKAGTVDAKGVSAVVRAHAGEVRECFAQARMYNADLKGRVTVQALVAPDGTAASSALVTSTAKDPRLEECIVAAFGKWTFPLPAGGVSGNAKYTFVFE